MTPIFKIVSVKVVLIFFAMVSSILVMAQSNNNTVDTDTSRRSNDTLVYSLSGKAPVYNILYRKESDINQVQSISYLKGDYLLSTPSGNILTALTGRIAGLQTAQSSGIPGSDGLNLSLRGRSPLIIVDGVPRSITSINPDQVESVTILKDALSTAMLGIRGMNGVVLITTKKGQGTNKAFQMNFKTQAGIQSPVKMRKYLSSFDYATLYNEALQNEGRPAVFSQADLDAYKNGTDPYGHPNVDWVKTILKDQAAYTQYTMNAEGSTNNMNYFVSLDYQDQGGLLKESDINKYSTNSSFKRYVFRSNLEVKIDDRTKVFLNLFGRVRTSNEPGAGISNILSDLNLTPNNAYPVFNPNNSLGGSIDYQSNIYGKSVSSGYYQTFSRDGFADAGFSRDMGGILKGWWIKGTLSYNTTMLQEIFRNKQFEVFKMNIGTLNDTTYERFGTRTLQSNASGVGNRSSQFFTEFSTGYSRNFNKNGYDVLLVANSDQVTVNHELAQRTKTIATNFQYRLADAKYLFQLAVAYSGNNRFEPGKQYGFFPSAGMAWNVHKEKFLAQNKFVNIMKLRATYGLTGNASPGYYEYIYRYIGNTGYVFGTGAGSVGGVIEAALPYSRTWEKSLKLNLGLDMQVAKNRGWFSLDYFLHNERDLLQSRDNGNYSSLIGINYPLENIGKNRYSGFELNLGWVDKVGKLNYSISGNFSTVNSEVVYNNEPVVPFSWMARTGKRVNMNYGYIADGFVTTAGQGPVIDGYRSVPGDLKYKDLNKDGLINNYDQGVIGEDRAFIFYGINASMRYKGFYIDLLFQGVAHRQINLAFSNDTWEFQSNGKAQAYPHHMERWTSATASTATYPRLTIGNNPNNHIASTFWLTNGDFFRLKNAEIGYLFSGGLISKAKLENVKLFINGLNLFTISPFKRAEPEAPFSNYPIQKVVNGGISITL